MNGSIFFDTNHDYLLKRYENLKSSAAYADSDSLTAPLLSSSDFYKYYTLSTYFTRNDSTWYASGVYDGLARARASLKVDKMGIFNCDQIARLKNPMVIAAKYRDEDGKILEPLVIQLIDSRVNGILQYDGYMNYGPKSFALSLASNNKLIAVTADGQVYLARSDDFPKTEDDLAQGQFTFVLHKMEKKESNKKLRDELTAAN
jgi:hypothetical protein